MSNIKIVYIEAALLPNGELISFGKSLGFVSKKQQELVDAGATKITKGGEDIVALSPNVA